MISIDLANSVMKVSGIFLNTGIWAFYPLHAYMCVYERVSAPKHKALEVLNGTVSGIL